MTYLWILYDVVAGIFILADIALVGGLVYAWVHAWHYHPTYKGHGDAAHARATHRQTMHDIVMKERWHAIMAKFASGTPEAERIAIIEADALVDSALKGMRMEGEHLADRLANLEADDIKSMPRIWRAHRLRNDLVHTPGYAVTAQEAERAMRDYEAFLREIEVID
jgi:hypothetical protein